MTTITINNTEYETDTFTDEQKGLVGEAQFLQSEINRTQYTLNLLNDRNAGVIATLKESLEGSGKKESSLILPEATKVIT